MKPFLPGSSATICLAACGTPDETAQLSFADAFVVRSSITVDESSAVLNVLPVVRPDPFGGYLVADLSESQVRRYGPDGSLLAAFGRRGDGPGEFQDPAVAVRIPSGHIVVLDRNGRMTVLDSSATAVVRAQDLPLRQVTPDPARMV